MSMGRFIDDTDAIVIPAPVEWFVDVVLTTTMLTTVPFYDPAFSGPGLVLVPAPGTGKALFVRQVVFISEQTKAGWGSDPQVRLFWGPASEGNSPLLDPSSLQLFGMAATNGASAYPNQTVEFPLSGGQGAAQPTISI